MSIEIQQKLKLSQQILITPQLQQAIKILQFSSLELEAFLEEQICNNPLLEEQEQSSHEEVEEKNEQEDLDDIFSLSEAYDDSKESFTKSISADNTDFLYNYEDVITEKETLRSHLLKQLNFCYLKDDDKALCLLLIDSINETGYLTVDENFLEKEGYTQKKREEMIKLLQSFDPPGVAARSLSECLLLQIKNKNIHNKTLEEIIKNFLEDLARKKYKSISKKLNISTSELTKHLEVILSLDAKPGRKFSSEASTYITPDIYIKKTSNGWNISLEPIKNENLGINLNYKNMLKNCSKEKDKEYIKTRVQEAKWLIKSLEQRKKTLLKVMRAILEAQEDFFSRGKEFLKPLVLKDIAKATELHESTISRITTNKYVHTNEGIFELRSFFNSSLGCSEGNLISSSVAKLFIQQLIKDEDQTKPLSDKFLQQKLQEKGIDIARRTVTKYREQLGFLPSTHRVRYR